MSKKIFSNEEIIKLKNNKYVKSVSEKGIRYPQFTERCITLGETLGVYRDLKVSKVVLPPTLRTGLRWV